MKPPTEHTERYTAVDEDGVEHLIDVYTDMIEVNAFGGPATRARTQYSQVVCDRLSYEC
jgi:hypothetical protein